MNDLAVTLEKYQDMVASISNNEPSPSKMNDFIGHLIDTYSPYVNQVTIKDTEEAMQKLKTHSGLLTMDDCSNVPSGILPIFFVRKCFGYHFRGNSWSGEFPFFRPTLMSRWTEFVRTYIDLLLPN